MPALRFVGHFPTLFFQSLFFFVPPCSGPANSAPPPFRAYNAAKCDCGRGSRSPLGGFRLRGPLSGGRGRRDRKERKGAGGKIRGRTVHSDSQLEQGCRLAIKAGVPWLKAIVKAKTVGYQSTLQWGDSLLYCTFYGSVGGIFKSTES